MKRMSPFYFAVTLLITGCHQTSPANLLDKSDTSIQHFSASRNYKDASKPGNRLFPDKLRDLPNEIITAHFPNPCYASFEDSMYIWKHNTTIMAREDLQLIEFGSFVYTEEGWYLRVTMAPQDFAKYYNCKDAILKKGIVYTDNASWRRDKELISGDAMWYYIAKDKDGRLVKGTAPIETEGKLLNSGFQTAKLSSSKITWTGYGEIGGYSLTGNINLKEGRFEMQNNRMKSAVVTMDMKSISHQNKNLESHLKEKDFFDVRKFETAVFKANTIEYRNANTATATGELTIRGISRPFTIPLTISKNGNTQIIKAKITIDRTLFGIKFNSKDFFENLEEQAIKNNFDLAFSITIT